MPEKIKNVENGVRLSGWAATVGLMAVATIFGGLGYVAINQDRPVNIALGEQSITIGGGAKFEDILEEALLTSEERTADLLDDYGYYHIGGEELVRAMRAFDVSDFRRISDPPGSSDLAALRRDEFRAVLLDMVGDLDGPFQTPGTLWAATEKFKNAITDLENAMFEVKEASPLLVWLWEKSIDREELFKKRVFKATVRPASGRVEEEHVIVAACAGNPFKDRMIQLFTPNLGGSVTAPLTIDISRMRCDEPDPPLARMLTGDDAIQIAISPGAAKFIFGPEGFASEFAKRLFADQDSAPEWTFEVLPRDLEPRIVQASN